MSPEILRSVTLPPGAPRRLRVGLVLLRFLAHHNRLDGYMAFVAVVWGSLTLMFPGFWQGWTVTAELNRWTGNNPWLLSVSLLIAGIGSYVSRHYRIDWLRSACALLAFSSWMMLVIIFLSVDPIFTPGVACYSLFAFAKAISYISFVINLDQRNNERLS